MAGQLIYWEELDRSRPLLFIFIVLQISIFLPTLRVRLPSLTLAVAFEGRETALRSSPSIGLTFHPPELEDFRELNGFLKRKLQTSYLIDLFSGDSSQWLLCLAIRVCLMLQPSLLIHNFHRRKLFQTIKPHKNCKKAPMHPRTCNKK